MNFKEIIRSSVTEDNIPDTVITSVTEDISRVKKGSLFFAVKGRNKDGNIFIDEAFHKGAAAVISSEISDGKRIFRTDNVRKALSDACCRFYYPSKGKMKLIGITGTNGKTSAAGYLRHILEGSGRRCALIGTLGSISGENSVCTDFTTPLPEILYPELEKHSALGNEYCVIEVSSQALALERTSALRFSLGILTNIGNDHIEWHGSREEYIKAKKRLFSFCENALINRDDKFSDELSDISAGKTYFYSLTDDYADYQAKNIRIKKDDVSYLMLDEFGLCKMRFAANGRFSVYNSLAAAAGANILGVSHYEITDACASLPIIRGRMEKVFTGDFDVYIDFAHTPEAFENALSCLREVTEGKVLCVFGCGGDRDKGKRAVMGSIAGRYCDKIIITSDNPRNEDPSVIADDIISGIKYINKIYKETDREKAIFYALSLARSGDSVLIAGKGHEDYIIKGNKKEYFSDEETVKKLLGV